MATRSTTKRGSAAERRARAEAARLAAERAERRRRWLVLGGGGGALVAVVAALIVVALATRPERPPTFPAPTNVEAAVQSAGLKLLSTEGQVIHTHQHLDVFVDGQKVQVPAGIGIAQGKGLSVLHTHDVDGIIHVESPTRRDYTLGQVFQEWQVRLTDRCLGNVCKGVKVYVNGQQVSDPNALVLKPHQEIAVVAGKPPTSIPSSYAFPPGV